MGIKSNEEIKTTFFIYDIDSQTLRRTLPVYIRDLRLLKDNEFIVIVNR